MIPFASPDDLQTFAGEAVDIDVGQARLTLELISDVIRGYCGWSITAETQVAATYVGRGSRLLLLPTLHLNAVSLLTVDGTELVEDDEFRVSAAGTLSFTSPPASGTLIEVIFDHGYQTAPGDLRAVALAAGLRQIRNPTQSRSRARTVEDFSDSEVFALPASGQLSAVSIFDDERLVIDRYLLPGRP